MSGPFRLSSRKQKKAVEAVVTTTSTLEAVLVAFLNRGFWGRMKWLFFGK